MNKVAVDCPNPACRTTAGDEKCHVLTDRQVVHCFRCTKSWGPYTAERLLKTARPRQQSPRVVLKAVPRLVSAWESKEATKYLHGRDVAEEDCPDVQYAISERRLYFSIYSPSPDRPRSYHTRSIEPEKGWRVHPGTIKGDYFYGNGLATRVVVVEGIFDQLRGGPGFLSILGSSLSGLQRMYLTRKFVRIRVWGDNDPAGQKLNEQGRLLGAAIVYSDKEPGDCDRDDPIFREVRAWLRS